MSCQVVMPFRSVNMSWCQVVMRFRSVSMSWCQVVIALSSVSIAMRYIVEVHVQCLVHKRNKMAK